MKILPASATYFVLFLILLVACDRNAGEKQISADAIKPPTAEKIPFEIDANGNKRVDNYFWMRLTEEQRDAADKDEQTKKVITYLNAENEYLDAGMKHTTELQDKIFNEIVGRIKQDDASVPYKENGYWYYTRYESNKEYPIYCRKKGSMGASEEVILNVNELADGHDYYGMQGISVSEDNNLLAYAEDTVSRRRYTIYVKDLRTG